MSTTRPVSAKIMQHSTGMGVPDPETVRQRAKELATINGRETFSDEDWRQAQRELHGGHGTNDTNGEADMAELISEHDMVVTSLGHHTENVGLEDRENVLEELIAEGMDEAEHEQMLEARRAENREDREERD